MDPVNQNEFFSLVSKSIQLLKGNDLSKNDSESS